MKLVSAWAVTWSLCAVSPALAVAATLGGLSGTDLSVQVQFQPNAAATRQALSFEAVETVTDAVEFPSLAALDIGSNPFNLFVVDVAIDAADQSIDITFENAGSGAFASGFFNGYLFQFDSSVPVAILSASVDAATTIGLENDDLDFVGNRLFVNVASLSFNAQSLARINLVAIGGPTVTAIPLPASAGLTAAGAALLVGALRRRRRGPDAAAGR